MSVLGDVFDSLKAMTLLQLLLAFIACTGYALAQGGLVSARARRISIGLAALSAIGFAFESSEWMYAAMLLAFAIAGMGLFVMLVWMTSSIVGFVAARTFKAKRAADASGAGVASHASLAVEDGAASEAATSELISVQTSAGRPAQGRPVEATQTV
jgi:hypothetical protein